MEWPRVPLGELVVDMQPGFACQPTATDDGFLQLRTNNVSSDGRIDLTELKRVPATEYQRERYALQRGDILFNNTNSPALVGKTAYFDQEGTYIFSNHMTRIRVDPEIADARYVARYLHWAWTQGVFRGLITQWVNQAAINRNQLSSVGVPLPPLFEQRRIVEILDQADRLRRLRAEADAKADRILPALVTRLLGPPSEWFRDARSGPLAELVDMVSGATPSKANEAYWSGGVPWISPKDMKKDFLADSEDHVSPAAVEESNLKLVEPGSVLIVVRGMILARDVPVALNLAPVTINQDMKALIPKARGITGRFLWASLSVARASLLSLVRTAAHGTRKLDTPELMRFQVVVPAPSKIARIDATVAEHQRSALRRETARQTIARLFAGLLGRAFEGTLTASWREAHMKELLQEMQQQAKALASG
jgi:type I restriction enzyme S subunit